jgi:hypothetical protein
MYFVSFLNIFILFTSHIMHIKVGVLFAILHGE